MNSSEHPEAAPSKSGAHTMVWLRLALLAVVALVIVGLHREFHFGDYFTKDRVARTIDSIRAWVNGYGVWGPMLFVLACASLTIVYCPVAMVIFVAVTLFGRAGGLMVSFAIIALGSSLVHFVSHRLGRPLIHLVSGGRWKKIEARIAHRELYNVVLMRLMLFMNPALNWALGLSGVSFKNMLVGTLLGTAPWVILLVWLSDEILGFVQSGNVMEALKHPLLLIPIALAIVLMRGTWLFDRLDKMRQHRHPAPPGNDANPS